MVAMIDDHLTVVDPPFAGAYAGSPRAEFGAFVEANYQRLVSELFTVTLDDNLAHDVVQDAFARAWPRWSAVRRLPDPTGWIRWTAMRTSRSTAGRLARRVGLSKPAGLTDISLVEPQNRALIAELRVLSFAERRALVLHHTVGMPIDEVASLERVPVGTIVARLSKASEAVLAGLSSPPPATEATDPATGDRP
jgi:RNA polymerase sigma-70 factor (ECF subfamily)